MSLDCTEDAAVDLTGLRGISPAFSVDDVASLFAREAFVMRSTGDFGESAVSRTLGNSVPVAGATLSFLDKLFLFPDIRLNPSSVVTLLLDASRGNTVASTVSRATVAGAWVAAGTPGRVDGAVFAHGPAAAWPPWDCLRADDAVSADSAVLEAVGGIVGRVGEETDVAGPALAAFELRRDGVSCASVMSASWAGLGAAAPPPTTSLKRLYRPLIPCCTKSLANPLFSTVGGFFGGGSAKSLKVVKASVRLAEV